jgi:hypothetical protein
MMGLVDEVDHQAKTTKPYILHTFLFGAETRKERRNLKERRNIEKG